MIYIMGYSSSLYCWFKEWYLFYNLSFYRFMRFIIP